MAKKTEAKDPVAAPRQKPSSLLDTRVIYCGDNLEQLAKLPEACIDLNRGYLVAKSLTKEAQAQLEQKKRLQFVRCTEDFLNPFFTIQILHRVIDVLPIVLRIKDRNAPPSPNPASVDWKSMDCRIDGEVQDFLAYMAPFIENLRLKIENDNTAEYQNTGTHWGQGRAEMTFSKGEMMMGQMDIESILIPLCFFLKTTRKKILSQFELEGQGRAYSFEPIEDFDGGKKLEIHLVHRLPKDSN